MTCYLFLKIPLASFGHSCCGLSICSVRTFQKPKQYHPELLTSLANVIHHELGTCALLDKPNNICCAFCNFPLIPHTLFSLSSCVLVRCVSDLIHMPENWEYAIFPRGSVPGEKLGQPLVESWQVSLLPASNGHWSVLPANLLDSVDTAPENCSHVSSQAAGTLKASIFGKIILFRK